MYTNQRLIVYNINKVKKQKEPCQISKMSTEASQSPGK